MNLTELKYGDVLKNAHGTAYVVKKIKPKMTGTDHWIITFNMAGEHHIPSETINLYKVFRNKKQIWPEENYIL